MNKQIICIASLTQDSGKSLIASSLVHLLREQGLKTDLFDSRMGILHHGYQSASPIMLVEMAEEDSLWYPVASEILLIADRIRSNGSLLRDASRFLDLMVAEQRPLSIRLVVNRVEDISQARDIYHQIRKETETRPSIHLKYFGYLPLDPVLETWKMEKKPFVVGHPETMATACLRSMVSRLKDQHQIWRGT
ncbi:MAG: hypothetical protein HY073_03515 [Deltaproteobacteria bacterium]|nr:hypothetical protein [Deltaproteobacteria bacterium]